MPPERQRPSQAWRERTPLFLPFPVRMFRRASERPAIRSYRRTPAKLGTGHIRIDECPNTRARQNTTSITRPHFAAEFFDFITL
jgi:hypothetical protein